MRPHKLVEREFTGDESLPENRIATTHHHVVCDGWYQSVRRPRYYRRHQIASTACFPRSWCLSTQVSLL